jgi:hypothetical protein
MQWSGPHRQCEARGLPGDLLLYFNDWGGRTGVLERVDYAQVGETTKLPTGGTKPQPRKRA